MRKFNVGAALCGLLLATFLVVPNPAAAQTSVSVWAGPTFATVDGDDFEDLDSKTGFAVGVGLSKPLNEMFAGFLGLAYVQKGAEDGDDEISIDYIQIPVLAGYGMPVGESAMFQLFGGPSFNFQIACDAVDSEVDEEGDCEDIFDIEPKSFEFGLLGGAELGFPIGESAVLSFGGGYEFGLTDAFEDVEEGEDLDGKNRTWFLFVGLGKTLGGM